jgi:hypothetical protein
MTPWPSHHCRSGGIVCGKKTYLPLSHLDSLSVIPFLQNEPAIIKRQSPRCVLGCYGTSRVSAWLVCALLSTYAVFDF